MKILFDHGTPAPLRHHLSEHIVYRSAELGWELLENGELLSRAEEDGFQVLVTTDQNIRYQQNLQDRNLAVVVLLATAWPRVRHHIESIGDAIAKTRPGQLTEVQILLSGTGKQP